MKTKTILSAVALMFATITTKAQITQPQETVPKKMQVGSVRIGAAMLSFNTSGSAYDQIVSHSSQGAMLRKMDAGYSWNNYGYLNADFGWAPYFSLSLHPYNKATQSYNQNREISLGLGIVHQHQDAGSSKETKIGGGDSVVHSYINYNERVNSILGQAAFIFKTEPGRRISLYIGYGAGLGASYSSDIIRTAHTDTMVTVKAGNNNYSYPLNNGYNSSSSMHPAASSFMAQVYFPWGASIRLAKTKPVLSNMSLGLEMQAGLTYQHFSKGESYVKDFLNTTISMRYNLAK